ncbi:DUF5916 domain-containing protein [Acetobacteroides hydrogenigenes]|uniref:Carbohydrate binding protein with CBM9 domain n=1 Tax=Acetobacteroides hydrogenigenes TaxID=979970 RepID=A0A4R2EUI8_9BACT|nr:DUF5916 domain-containing protein [Acetobacteroides hydrogenigenes]TCN72295.1 carbohydrate binding protein with CBM9 domain [Acetobacteroides hydrogenigenes]
MKASFLIRLIAFSVAPLLSLNASAQQERRAAEIVFTDTKPKIDGDLADSVWAKAKPLTSYTQYSPNRLEPAKLKTEVRLLYDKSSIYVYGRMEDTAACKIAKQLGPRDSFDDPNCDLFSIGFSPYNDGTTSYYFLVSAAGVQSDQKVTGTTYDRSWNAVWYSAVKLHDWGWSVELEIPLTQLRFSAKNGVWGFNHWRLIKRNSEWDTYNPVDISIEGINNQEANLVGLDQIKMPFRLSLTPYVSYATERSNRGTSNTFKGGLDLRYGISDSFTLDMMVIPDFSQVRSDDVQLNLTTVEQRFNENRQFFNEGSELFSRGGIFYSRRIGSNPLYGFKAYQNLKVNEEVKEMPSSTNIINATKISGRTKDGLGIGFMNALTADAYAKIRNAETGETREVNVQPLTNYNVSVVDIPFRNSSYLSVINGNVLLPTSRFTANTSAADFYFANKSQSYALRGSVQYALQADSGSVSNDGFAYQVSALKTSGKLRLELSNTLYQDTYNPSYLGYLDQNNRIINFGRVEYISYDRSKHTKFRRLSFFFTNELLYKPTRYSRNEFTISGGMTFHNEFHFDLETSVTPGVKYDYFEPRQLGYKYAEPRAIWAGFNFNTDTRKRLSISRMLIGYWIAEKYNKSAFYLQMNPSVRFNDRLATTIGFFGIFNENAIGYAENDATSGVPVFGRRDIKNYEQSAELNYILSKNAFANIRARYNWTSVHYKQFYHLKNDGWVEGVAFLQNRDINYTAASLEASFAWTFAPGSQLSLLYRKSFDDYRMMEPISYSDNIRRMGDMPQRDLISARLIYYWGY